MIFIPSNHDGIWKNKSEKMRKSNKDIIKESTSTYEKVDNISF